jgi:hypothetical protein
MTDPHDNPLRPLIGLDGPSVSINVTPAEVELFHRLVNRMTPGDSAYEINQFLRELDIRIGAARAMRPETDPAEVTAPMTMAEVDVVRRVYRLVKRYTQDSAGPMIAELVRDFDVRIGAAQAAMAERVAAGAFEQLDNLGTPDSTVDAGEPRLDPRDRARVIPRRRFGWPGRGPRR